MIVKDGKLIQCQRDDIINNSVEVPTTVQKIMTYSFHSCENVKSITVPDSVSKIDNYVFDNCKLLQ